ncbi:MAG: dual specificity protein phosphatase family protein [Kiritimatiellae bacterium]|nr:dual specificity protein phosphatase family protein [Kiritimatiellia bacterium]
MKITILPRSYFEERMEGGEIRSLLINHKIISIQSSSGWDSVPPFHEEVRSLPNLLCITLDDYFAIPDDEDEKKLVALFSYEIADQIMRFVDDGKMPIIIHCTAGISRSGAIGSVLNRYYNSILANNKEDYDAFFLLNSKIMPNPNIVRAFSEFLDIDSVM